MSQQEHMAEAKRMEKLNTESLNRLQLEHVQTDRRLQQSKSTTEAKMAGDYCIWMSWSSERLPEPGRENEDRHIRDMLFFVNMSIPQKSCIPDMYRQTPPKHSINHKCAVTGNRAKYYDRLTKSYYADSEAFRVLRNRYLDNEECQITRSLDQIQKHLQTATITKS